ncbi:MAG: hypothetical protein NZ959_04990 [Armatimonadetes bacterium]|nr:hypothetical protein [Armatimonadota bacterium]
MLNRFPDESDEWGEELSPGEKDQVKEILKTSPHPQRAWTQWLRLRKSSGTAPSLVSFLREDPASLEALFFVLGASGFVGRTFALHPEYLEFIRERHYWAQVRDRGYFSQQVRMATEPLFSLSAKADALRRLRRREVLRIAVADLLGLVGLDDVTRQLSDLAEALLSASLRLVIPEFSPILMVAYGKLGANELNYSSDVDLAFFCEGDPSRWEPFILRFLSLVTDVTPFGRLYQVDLRLRPYGVTGPLVLPVDAAFSFYEGWADPMDRIALLKARVIFGDEELTDRWESFRRSWVFGRTLEPEELIWILRTKERSERTFGPSGALSGEGPSVKHGVGGIRDVEFCAQILQLAFAWQNPDLIQRDTLSALQKLHESGLLTKDEKGALEDGYRWLRMLEHRLQLLEDLPTWHLPSQLEELESLARTMGAPSAEQFLAQLEKVRQKVREVFLSVTEELKRTTGLTSETAIGVELAAGLDADPVIAQEIGFTNWQRVQQHLHRLLGDSLYTVPWRDRLGTMRLLPIILKTALATYDPEGAIVRLERVAKALGSPPSFFQNITHQPGSLKALLTSLSLSESLCQLMVQYPEYLEALLSGAVEPSTFSPSFSDKGEDLLDERVASRWLRRWIARHRLFLGFWSLCRLMTGREVSRRLSETADDAVRFALQCLGSHLAVMALGGWGSEDLHFDSDLDAAFVGPKTTNNFEQEALRLVRFLSERTEEGLAYRLDLRLRPGGQEGALVHSVDAWWGFAGEFFEPWMALSWTRLRWVAGSEPLGCSVITAVHQRLYRVGLSPSQWEELIALVRRIVSEHRPPPGVKDLKHSPGCLWDIEMAVSLIQLKTGNEDSKMQSHRTEDSLERLSEKEPQWLKVQETYRWLKELRLWVSLLEAGQPPRFVFGDPLEKKLAWLLAHPQVFTSRQPADLDDAVASFRQLLSQQSGDVQQVLASVLP